MDEHGRRRFLKTASVGMTATIAGCGSAEDAPAQSSTEDRVTVTLGIEPDTEAFQERQQELVEEVEAGNVTRAEAQSQLSELEEEVLAEAATEAQEHLESGGAEVEAVDEAAGVLRANGDPAALIETLAHERIAAMLEAGAYGELTESPSGEGGDGNTTGGTTEESAGGAGGPAE